MPKNELESTNFAIFENVDHKFDRSKGDMILCKMLT